MLTPPTEEDARQLAESIKKLEEFFPSRLFIELYMAEARIFRSAAGYREKMNEFIEDIAELIDLKLTKQDREKLENGDETEEVEEDYEIARLELKQARSSYAETWIANLIKNRENRQHTNDEILDMLDDDLWPPNTGSEDKNILNSYLFSDTAAQKIAGQFCANVRQAVTSSPDGLLLVPQNSTRKEGVELRIKRSNKGYYLA